MATDTAGSFCQNCFTWNAGDRETCRKCGMRLFIVSGDQGWEEDEVVETEEDLDEHLLERITALEETMRRVETYLETVSDQLGKLERSEVMLRNGLMALVQEMETRNQLDGGSFSERWEHLVEDNLHLIGARELFTRYRGRILPIAKPKSMSQLKRALLETSAFLEAAQVAEAADRLGQALALDPKNYELIFTVAALKEVAGQLEDAETLVRRTVALSPRHYEAWMLLAKVVQALPDRMDEAVEALREAADLRPDESEPRLQLAELLLDEDDLQGAMECIQEAIALQREGDTLTLLGEIHLARGESAQAIAVLKEASSHLPGDLAVRELLAEGYIQAGERSKAFAILQELLQQHPNDPNLLLLLDAETPAQLRSARGGKTQAQVMLDEVQAWLEEGNLREAESWLRKAKRKGKSERLDLVELQVVFRKQPAASLAKALAFAESHRHPRLCFMALRLVLEHLMEADDHEGVEAALTRYLKAHPKSSGAWEAALMRAAHRLLKGALAESDLKEVRHLAASPLPGQEARARTLLGQYLLAMKRPADVVELLDPILEKEPTLINFFQLSTALAALGAGREATALLKEGMDADPGDLRDDQAEGVRRQMKALLGELEDHAKKV